MIKIKSLATLMQEQHFATNTTNTTNTTGARLSKNLRKPLQPNI